ncbi:ABC transporter permease [Neobacillus piezotolerans]|uniref:ABC transporter permease n=1 Tax=Neobacillus piezotolerans TaxID=2259171 RepID=A0A3D8GXB6_9BACI|nr:ABC transporter permease [Neobacillus piezotolerans]
MFKLMRLEWKKLKRLSVISEVIIYWLILMFMPVFFIKMVMPDFGQNYAAAIELNSFTQMGFILFGGSLINQVFIEEYKNKTISLSFGYPISRKKLFTAKVLFISLSVFLATFLSFIFTGLTTYLLDQVFPIINGQPTNSDIIAYFYSTITRSFIITLISFIPLFLFGILKRLTVPTVVCSIATMQLPNFSSFLHLEPNFIILVLCILGALSISLSIKTAESVGEI